MRRASPEIWDCVESVVHGLDYIFVGAVFTPQGTSGLLRVYIDADNGIDVEDCARVSRQLSAVLDVEDPISTDYVLEVSSPGLDRPLFSPKDFASVEQQFIKVKMQRGLQGRRNFKGRLVQADDEQIRLQGEDADEIWDLPLDDIDEARVIPKFKD